MLFPIELFIFLTESKKLKYLRCSYSSVIKCHSIILHAKYRGNNQKFSSFQRIITELDQNLRSNVEQILQTGKRLYSTDSSGIESAGMYISKREVVLYLLLFYLFNMICYDNRPVEKKILFSSSSSLLTNPDLSYSCS